MALSSEQRAQLQAELDQLLSEEEAYKASLRQELEGLQAQERELEKQQPLTAAREADVFSMMGPEEVAPGQEEVGDPELERLLNRVVPYTGAAAAAPFVATAAAPIALPLAANALRGGIVGGLTGGLTGEGLFDVKQALTGAGIGAATGGAGGLQILKKFGPSALRFLLGIK